MKAVIAHSNESMERFFNHILTEPIPSAVTLSYLAENGFNLHNDPELRLILRQLGFLGEKDEKPTAVWQRYKEEGTPVLREQVMKCYQGLFALHPDAASLSSRELESWFAQPPITSGAESSVKRAIRTFKKLCTMAEMIMTPTDNREINSLGIPAQNKKLSRSTPLFVLPAAGSQAEYQAMFQALKDIFYSD